MEEGNERKTNVEIQGTGDGTTKSLMRKRERTRETQKEDVMRKREKTRVCS